MNKPSLAIAYGIKKQSKGRRMPVGEMTSRAAEDDMPRESKLSMIDAIRAKMNKGGMCMSDGGMVESDMASDAPDSEDFLSDEADTDAPGNAEMDGMQLGEMEGEGESRKALLSKILSKRIRG